MERVQTDLDAAALRVCARPRGWQSFYEVVIASWHDTNMQPVGVSKPLFTRLSLIYHHLGAIEEHSMFENQWRSTDISSRNSEMLLTSEL